ncbi:MAG: SDR family NAD(P)-dependent oxidoreductase [Promethearchaeota archaeon]
MEKNQKYALVTGGSSGIGMELSKLLAKDGYSLIIVAKPPEELNRAKAWFDENMPTSKIIYRQQDLAIQEAAEELYNFTTQNGYNIDILINNAGFGAYGWYHEFEIERDLAMINLNVVTNYLLTRLYLKDMVAKNYGKILITSSQGGLGPTPKSAAYSAAKSFSFYYGVAINEELKELGVDVSITVLLPPPTRTGFQHTARMDHLKTFDKSNRLAHDPDYVAKEAYEALKSRKMMVMPGRLGRFLLKLFTPTARKRVIRRYMKLAKWGTK